MQWQTHNPGSADPQKGTELAHQKHAFINNRTAAHRNYIRIVIALLKLSACNIEHTVKRKTLLNICRFLINACMMHGMHSLAFCPRTSGITGTCLQPRSSSPSFCTMISNIFLACARLISCCGKKSCAIPYSLSFPSSIPAFCLPF